MNTAPQVLVVAGHDPTGGAGVDADRAAIEQFGGRASCVVTAHTQQDGQRVFAVEPRPAPEWLSEARRVLREELVPGSRAEATGEGSSPRLALKSGLLSTAQDVRALGLLIDTWRAAGGEWVVVDPVLSASGGEPFLDELGVAALRSELVAAGVVLTPNLPEAARLTNEPLHELAARPERRVEAARRLLLLGARAVLLKGGHGGEDPVRDLLLEPGCAPVWIEHARVPGRGLHGSGCRYASAVAAQLAAGTSLADAANAAGAWLAELIAGGESRDEA